MVNFREGAVVPQQGDSPRATHAHKSTNGIIAILMVALLIASIAGVVVALSSGMPTVAILIALVSGAVFAGSLC